MRRKQTGRRYNAVHAEPRAVRERVNHNVREAAQGRRARQRRFY